MKLQVELIPISAVKPSTYNPRHTDAQRLELIKLSLVKLGFLLPIYADPSGEILSGHQRHLVAQQMGCTQIPVTYTPPMDLNERKAVNIAFNRATNDLKCNDTPNKLTKELEQAKVIELGLKIADKQIDTPEFNRCLTPTYYSTRELARINQGNWIQYSRAINKSLHAKKIVMPIILRPDLTVINGIGRLQVAAEKGIDEVPVIIITQQEADFANAMLNLLSMDFDIHTRYADLLRMNSFRRARRVREGLGRGFVFQVVGNKPAYSLDIHNPIHKQAWIQEYGKSILDFGAGHLTESRLLESAGISVTPFEPYRLRNDNQIDKEESLQIIQSFLQRVSSGHTWDSIFISSVLNSIPFEQDRKHIIQILAALCTTNTKVYAVASSDHQTGWRHTSGGEHINSTDLNNIGFILNYESRIRLGEISSSPKVQKYHTPEEFEQLFRTCFQSVRVFRDGTGNVCCIAQIPKLIETCNLQEAIAFEFNLPYPDGSRMSLINEALDAFSKRLTIEFPIIEPSTL